MQAQLQILEGIILR